MENYDNVKLQEFVNLSTVSVRRICCGCFTGQWKSSLPFNRLIYIFESGPKEGSIRTASEICPLHPGRWLLIPAFLPVMHDQRDGIKLVSIHFSWQFYSQMEILAECDHLFQGDAFEKFSEFESMLESGNLSSACGLLILLWHFLKIVAEKEKETIAGQMDAFSSFTPLLERFNRDVHSDFSVTEMARIMKMGNASFIKHFSGKTGVPPRRFFNRLRAMAIVQELLDFRITIREISIRFAFPNEFYFSRFFRRHFGVSPRQYREKNRLLRS